MKIEENEVYNSKDVAQILKVSMPTIKRMLREKKLKSFKIGKQHRFLGRDILAMLSGESVLVANVASLFQPVSEMTQLLAQAPPVAAATVVVEQPRTVAQPAPRITSSVPPPPERAVRMQPQRQDAVVTISEVTSPVVPSHIVPPSPAPPPIDYDMMRGGASTAEVRQRVYMLGKTLLKDVFDSDGNLLFEQGCVVTDSMIETAKKKHKLMVLFSSIEHED